MKKTRLSVFRLSATGITGSTARIFVGARQRKNFGIPETVITEFEDLYAALEVKALNILRQAEDALAQTS
ncbi:hypothetical protein [Arcanobacterium hippocoleae]|uniref:hypothetical protein n=1 Tax=Arcanobacterium hippocoleae TaxID=149017 RepID=UPI0033405404